MRLRLVVLDNMAAIIKANTESIESAQRVFGDLVRLRQVCFAGVRETFLNLDSNDLCATHVLLYDQTQIFEPRLLAGLRICWEERTRIHGIRLPFEDRLLEIAPQFSKEFEEYRSVQPNLVNPNMWYVAPVLGYNKTKIPLSEILIWVMTKLIRDGGANGYCAVINEEFKTSRWFQNYGDWNQDLEYMHPALLKRHKVMFVTSFYEHYLEAGLKKYGELYSERIFISSEEVTDSKAESANSITGQSRVVPA